MDPLTHSAAGVFLGRAGLNRFSEHAPWVLLLAANAPDIDILALAGGSLSYLNYHRHLTHALAALPVMALLPVVVVRLFSRKPFRWRAAYGLSCLAVLSHLLLDYTNIYGIRLFLPFSSRWYHLDLTSVVDLWIWAALALAFTGPVLVRLVNAEIGVHGAGPGRGFAVFALVFMLLYNGGRAVLHARATEMLNSRMYAGASPLRVAALPGPFNPFSWRGLAETQELYSVQDFSVLEEFDPSRSARFYKAEPGPAVAAANATQVFRDFFGFSQYPLERTTPLVDPENATRVEAMDMRFGTPDHPAFVAAAIINARSQVTRSWFGFGAARPR